MTVHFQPFTPYPDVNEILNGLLARVREVLGDQLVGMYLDGSLANGDFDEDSDIDFVVVTRDEIPQAVFSALQSMHDQLAGLDSIWAVQLEGSYISRHAIRRYDPDFILYPNIERGQGERLKLARHDTTWDIHRIGLIQNGIILLGPHPKSLIDPISPAQLRQAMQPVLFEWAAKILADPNQIQPRGYQSYTVLTLCRILYTLQTGTVVSKPFAARWAQQALDPLWIDLIQDAWLGRHHPEGHASPLNIQKTLDFIQYGFNRAQ